MTLAAMDPPRRGVIVSRSRATEIAERIAEKHDIALQTLLCAKWDRYARAARAELATELHQRLHWSQRAIGAFIGIHWTKVRSLFVLHENNQKRAARCLPRANLEALLAVQGDEARLRILEAEERAADLEAEIKRLRGDMLATRLADGLHLTNRLRCAILLAILAEAYPDSVPSPRIIELYDEAADALDYGIRDGCNLRVIITNARDLRLHFKEQKWPAPLDENCGKGVSIAARRLSDEAAHFLHRRFGIPRLSQIERARERREGRGFSHG